MGETGAAGGPGRQAVRRAAAAPHARAGAAILVGAGAAVAVLQVLQQVIGAFNPRPVITTLIAAAVALATLALDRVRTRRQKRVAAEERERKLRRSLVCWPPPLVTDVVPYEVGVFPRRRSADGDDRYVPRRVDERLAAAIAESPFVLVYGEGRAGKSRTALQAAAKALPDAVVIAPNGADGLNELLDLDPPIQPRAPQALLWLDSLERYHEALDAGMFDTFEEMDVPVTIVATIRTADYDELLAASGESGDGARAVAARARAFEVPVELDDDELQNAQALYDGEDFSAGLGPCFAASGKEEAEAPGRETTAPREVDEPEPPIVRDPLFALPAAGSVAALALVGIVSLVTSFTKPEPPSLGAQADAIKRAAAAGGRFVVQSQKVDFHGDPSYLFVFENKDFQKRAFATPAPPSDEIRIYDPRGSKLVERFRFQPSEGGAQYQFRFAGDLDGNGEGELIGGYGFPREASLAVMPFIVYWDAQSSTYKIVSLQPKAPALTEGVRAKAAASPFLSAYARRVTLTDPARRLEIAGHRVQDFAVTKGPNRLVSAVVANPRTSSTTGRVELQGNIIQLSGEQPKLNPCRVQGAKPLLAPWSPGRLLFLQIAEEWKPFVKTRVCAPVE